jgi:hypothetical protein
MNGSMSHRAVTPAINAGTITGKPAVTAVAADFSQLCGATAIKAVAVAPLVAALLVAVTNLPVVSNPLADSSQHAAAKVLVCAASVRSAQVVVASQRVDARDLALVADQWDRDAVANLPVVANRVAGLRTALAAQDLHPVIVAVTQDGQTPECISFTNPPLAASDRWPVPLDRM